MKTQRRMAIAIVAGLLAVAMVCLASRQHGLYRCRACVSIRHEFVWQLRVWGVPPLPLSEVRDEVRPSHVLRDLMPPSHRHDWVLASRAVRQGLGLVLGSIASGRDVRNEFTWQYEGDADFRAYVKARIDAGEVSAEELAEVVLLPPMDEELAPGEGSAAEQLRDRLLNAYFESTADPIHGHGGVH